MNLQIIKSHVNIPIYKAFSSRMGSAVSKDAYLTERVNAKGTDKMKMDITYRLLFTEIQKLMIFFFFYFSLFSQCILAGFAVNP